MAWRGFLDMIASIVVVFLVDAVFAIIVVMFVGFCVLMLFGVQFAVRVAHVGFAGLW